MSQAGVRFRPRHGDGIVVPFRDKGMATPERDVVRERHAIIDYLDSLPSEYVRFLQGLALDAKRMPESCAVSVLVPSRGEVRCLPWFMELIAAQCDFQGSPLSPDLFEILILCNRAPGEKDDGSARFLRWWVARNGNINVSVLEYTHAAGEYAPLTMARKILADLALYRAVQRNSYRRPLYLACQDVDLLWIDPFEIAWIRKSLDENSAYDAVRGQQDRCPWIMQNYPSLFLVRRSWNFCEAYAGRRSLRPERNVDYDFNWNRRLTSGWNTAFTAEIYAEIRGYTRIRRFEEDMDIGEKISCLRGYAEGHRFIPQTHTVGRIPTRSEGSCRRWIYSLLENLHPYDDSNDYDNFFNVRHERTVKTVRIAALQSQLANSTEHFCENGPAMAKLLQGDLDFMVRCGGTDGERAYQRILHALGFRDEDFEINVNVLRVRDSAGAIQRIEAYKRRWSSHTPGHPARLFKNIGRRTWRSASQVDSVHNEPTAIRSFSWSAGIPHATTPRCNVSRFTDVPLIVFDLDGTLVDSESFAVDANRRAIEAVCDRLRISHPVPLEEVVHAAFGTPATAFLKSIIPDVDDRVEQKVNSLAMDIQAAMLRSGQGRLFDGAHELLRALVLQGRQIAFVSNGSVEYIQLLMSHLELRAYTELWRPANGCKADAIRGVLRQIDTGLALVVGDRQWDVDAARQLNLPSIGCLYGYGDPSELVSADTVVSSICELAETLGVGFV